jgi:hypothetical protein
VKEETMAPWRAVVQNKKNILNYMLAAVSFDLDYTRITNIE